MGIWRCPMWFARWMWILHFFFLQDLFFSWICWKWNWKFNFLKLFYLLSLALQHFCHSNWVLSTLWLSAFSSGSNGLFLATCSCYCGIPVRSKSAQSHMRIIKLLWGRTEQTVLPLSNPSLSFCATVSLITAAAVTWFLEYFFFPQSMIVQPWSLPFPLHLEMFGI